MKIYLVRHGQTNENREGILQGRSRNHNMSEEGVRQIKRLKEKLKEKPIDIAYTSPLVRCWETAILLVGDRVWIQEDNRLIERELGNFEGKHKEEYDFKKYWDYHRNTDEEGVEKIQDIIQRCESFLKEILEKYPDKNVLIITHNTNIRILHHLLHQTNFETEKNLLKLEIGNAYFEEIEVKEAKKLANKNQ